MRIPVPPFWMTTSGLGTADLDTYNTIINKNKKIEEAAGNTFWYTKLLTAPKEFVTTRENV